MILELLRRCRDLLAADGTLHVELAAPGTPSWTGRAWMSGDDGIAGGPFRWAALSTDDIAALAVAAALRVSSTWTEEGRWFATLSPL